MGPTTKNVDIFGTFLGGADREKTQSAGFPSIWPRKMGGMEADQVPFDAARIEKEILARLNIDGDKEVVSLGELVKSILAKPTQIMTTLADLSEAKLIEEADDGFKLTMNGRNLVKDADLK